MQLGAQAPAIEALRGALRANPASGRASADLVNLLAGTGRHEEALALARDFLAQHPGERHVLAALGFALRDAGCTAEADALVDYEQLLVIHDTPVELAARLAPLILADPSLTESPASKATRGGGQTGELDLGADPALAALGRLLTGAVRAFAARLAAGALATHPAMARAAPDWTIRAWGVVLTAGGRQLPHIHPTGWLSGVYYVAVPPPGEAGAHGGWLELGAAPERFLVAAEPPLRAIRPQPGRLLLFPSYFYHRTRPFAGHGRRISIAFDVVPLRA
jgi:uncharacterized protein (TIGR02466 family)